MQATRIAAYVENHVTLGVFEVDGRAYALEASGLREVVRWQPITPLPNAPALIEGVIDLRGVVVPVVDLSRALGGTAMAPGWRSRIAVTEVDGLVMGLIVDAVLEVVPVAVDQLEEPPALVTQTGYDAARAIVRRPDAEPILVLSLEHLLERVYRSALPTTEEPS